MRITFLIHQIAKGGGMALQAVNLAKSLNEKGQNISIISTSKFPINRQLRNYLCNVNYFEIDSRWAYYPPLYYTQTISFFEKKIKHSDILQCFNPFFDAVVALKIKKKRKIPIVIRLGAVYENYYLDKLFGEIRGKNFHNYIDKLSVLINIVLKKVLEKCDVVIFNSKFLKGYYKRIENPNKIIIRNGIDTTKFNYFTPIPEELLTRFQIEDPTSQKILYVGRIEPRKSLETLILAFSMLPSKIQQSTTLFIVGPAKISSEYYSFLLNLIRKKSLQGRIKFLGDVEYESLPFLYSLADLVVFTSDYRFQKTSEGLPNVVLESLACKRPCLAADIAGVREVITHMENGILFLPNNSSDLSYKISLLLEDNTLCKKLGMAGRKTIVAEHSLGQVVMKYESIYDRLYE
ncbi:MAG: glycosyltransferase family 4 protein [Candidatus Thorarchaeota archaeon]